MPILLLLIAVWLVLIAVRFRHSVPVLVGGLVATAAVALALIAHGDVRPEEVGLVAPRSWPLTLGLSGGWAVLMVLLTPAADLIATALFTRARWAPSAQSRSRGSSFFSESSSLGLLAVSSKN